MRRNRILLVDDEVIIRRTLAKVLSRAGHEVAVAGEGAEAMRRFREEPYDAIITDVTMEGLDGMELLREAKELDPDVCVILISGYCDASSAIEALRLGAEEYLTKPFDFDELLLRLSRRLETRDLRRKLRLYEGVLPRCVACGRVRDEAGTWMPLEDSLRRAVGSTDAGSVYCPDCADTREAKGRE